MPQVQGFVDEADLALKGHLAQFTLTLLKALMTTGIYPPDHPAVKEVASEPFGYLKRLAPATNEITFMAASAAVGDDLMVDGVLSEAVPFVNLLHSSMGEVFAKKFISYFERNNLVSFAIKTRISKDEFQRLVAVFAAYRVEDEGGKSADLDFSELLLENGILHVSAMLRSEVIGGERPLPWRVKMAISRLRKDLRNIPLYAQASAQELAAAKRSLIQDITRPLRRPQFLKELLSNTDLITHDVEGLEEEEVRGEVIAGLHPGMLVNISWDVVGDLERASWGTIHQTVGGVERRLDVIFKEILKESAVRLREWEPETVKELMRHLFDKKILAYAELPQSLQDEMRLDKWTTQFLTSSDAILNRLMSLEDEAVYEEYARTLKAVYPELLKRGHSELCVALLRILSEHDRNASKVYPGRQALAREVLDALASDANMARLTDEAYSDNREQRRRAFECFGYFGELAIGALFEVLWGSTSASVRREAVAAIESMGDDAHVPLLEILGDKGREWFVYRNAILLAVKTECVAAADDIRKYLKHPHPRVREEAMQALIKFTDKASCADVVGLMSDADVSVRRKAISSLARLDCRIPAFLGTLIANVSPPSETGKPVNESVVLESLVAIRTIGVFEAGGTDVRVPLLKRLSRESQSKLKKWLKKESETNDDHLRCAVLDTLGAIGDRAVGDRLKPVLKDPSAQVRGRAAAAISAIRERQLGS